MVIINDDDNNDNTRSSPATPLLQRARDQDGFDLTAGQVSWVGSLMPLGALIGRDSLVLTIFRLTQYSKRCSQC